LRNIAIPKYNAASAVPLRISKPVLPTFLAASLPLCKRPPIPPAIFPNIVVCFSSALASSFCDSLEADAPALLPVSLLSVFPKNVVFLA